MRRTPLNGAYRFSLKNCSMAAQLDSSLPPSTVTVTVSPVLMPMPMRAMSLVAAADLLPSALVIVTVLSRPLAALANRPAGRAWMPIGSVMVY